MIGYTRPGLLVLLLLLPLAWWQMRHTAQRIALYKQKRVLLTRLLLLALLVLAAAGTEWRSPSVGRDIVVLLDASHSMPRLYEQAIQHLSDSLHPNDRLGFITFGNDVHVAKLPGQPAFAPLRLPDGEGTDIEQAIRAGLSLLTPQRSARLLLISDGLQTHGAAQTTVTALQEANVPLDVLPVIGAVSPEVAVDVFRLPASVRPDEPFTARAVITATEATAATVYVFRNDVLLQQYDMVLQAGGNVFTVENLTEQQGSATYEIVVEAEADTWWQNNRSQAVVHTTASAPVLLLTNNRVENTALSLALVAQGLDVTVQYVGQAPLTVPALQPYDAVILDNISAAQLSTGQMQALSVYVRQAGGGLIISGGDQSFGQGLYAGTPLEQLSPLRFTGTDTLSIPSVAVVLAIDKSGSMSEIVTETNLSKLDFAKEAVLGVMQSLAAQDLIGIVAFDSHATWVVPLQGAQHKDWLAAQVLSIQADGGTNAYPALQEAYDALFGVQAAVKHVVLLSDGYTTGGDFARLATDALNRGISVSTVGVGDADRELLAQIASWGGGRHYYTDDPHEIPYIFFAETQRLSPPQVQYRNAAVRLTGDVAFLLGLPDSWPAVAAYAITEPKNETTVHLVTDDGYPLLASWRTGLGRVAAFTGGLTPEWSPQWLSWSALGPFWAQTARWVMRQPSTTDVQAHLEIHQGQGHVWVDAVDGADSYVNFLDLTATVHRPDGSWQSLPLHQSGPGRYQATFAASDTGIWTVSVVDEQGELDHTMLASAITPYSPEYRVQAGNVGLLTSLANDTGGAVIPDLDTPLPAGPTPVATGNTVPLWPFLLTLGLIMFILDLIWRYVPADFPRYAGQQLAARLRRQHHRWLQAQQGADAVRARRRAERRPVAPDSRQRAARDAHTYLARARKKRHAGNDGSRRVE